MKEFMEILAGLLIVVSLLVIIVAGVIVMVFVMPLFDKAVTYSISGLDKVHEAGEKFFGSKKERS